MPIPTLKLPHALKRHLRLMPLAGKDEGPSDSAHAVCQFPLIGERALTLDVNAELGQAHCASMPNDSRASRYATSTVESCDGDGVAWGDHFLDEDGALGMGDYVPRLAQ